MTLTPVGTWLPENHGAVSGKPCDTAWAEMVAGIVSEGGGTVILTPGSTYVLDNFWTPPTKNITIVGGANNGLVLPVQVPIHITSYGGPIANGYWTKAPTNGTPILQLAYSGSSGGKINLLGQGRFEMDHITVQSPGSDNFPFIFCSNASVRIHDIAVKGNGANSGRACSQDFILFGGSVPTIGGAIGDAFQGYSPVTKLSDNAYDHIRAAAVLGTYANGIVIEDEAFSITCGSSLMDGANPCGAPYVLAHGAEGNTISRPLIEMSDQISVGHYDYASTMLDNCVKNTFDALQAWDAGGTPPCLGMVYCGAGSTGNTLIALKSNLDVDVLPWTGGPEAANQILVGHP